MLETGHQILGCRVEAQIASNPVYETYSAVDAAAAHLSILLFLGEEFQDKTTRQAAIALVRELAAADYPGLDLPRDAAEVDGRLACLFAAHADCRSLTDAARLWPPAEALALIRQIAGLLSEAHSAGYCHGALAPQTVCLQDGLPRLLHFSLAKLCRLEFDSGLDPHYVSPEQVRGESFGSSADIYSLGCLFYALVVGKAPFSGNDPFQIAVQRLHEDFPPLPEIAAEYQLLLDKMVDPQPAKRLTATELVSAVDQLLNAAGTGQTEQVVVGAEPSGGEDVPAAGSERDEFDSADIAAKIEARLQALAEEDLLATSAPPMTAGQPDVDDATAAIVESQENSKPPYKRYVLSLLLGVIIGLLLYSVFFDEAPRGAGVSVESGDAGYSARELDEGIRLWRAADFGAAEAEFRQLIARDPTDPRAYNNLAAIQVAAGDLELARKTLETALDTNHDYAAVYRNLAAVYAGMARDSYGKALQLDPADRSVALALFSGDGLVSLSVAATRTLAAAVTVVPEEVRDSAGADASAAQAEEMAALPPAADMAAVGAATTESVAAPVAVVPAVVEEDVASETGADPLLGTVERALQAWAQAWEGQDVEAYLAFYAEDFVPGSGVSRPRWEQQRRDRLAAPSDISVTLENVRIVDRNDEVLTVDVDQRYTSDVYSDLTKKRFELRCTEGRCRIVRELALEVIH